MNNNTKNSLNESQRLNVLYQYQILDTQPDEVFDELTQLAADVCETPVAFISLIDDQREWLKSKVGLDCSEFPCRWAFGNYTIQQKEIFIIPDIKQTAKFVDHPLVISEPYLRFYVGIPLINEQGFALGCLAVMDFVPRQLNIKEQKILQGLAKQVMKNLELYRQKTFAQNYSSWDLLFVNHPEPMWMYDIHTLQFLEVNTAALLYYGYSRDEFLQMQIMDICPPEDVQKFLSYLAENSGSKSYSRWQNLRKDGKIISVEITSDIINYAGHDARLVSIKNWIEHETLEITIKNREDRFNKIFQAIPIPLIISRLSDGLILYANADFQRTFSLSEADLVNYHAHKLYSNPDKRQQLLTTFRENGLIHNYEIQLKRRDGSDFWAIASLRYLKFNQEPAILKTFYDITERKKSEFKLQEQKEFLQTVFENIPLMIAINDANGKIQWINPYLEKTLGWSLQDYQNSDIWSNLYPDTEYRQVIQDFIQTKQAIWADFQTHTKDGRIIDTSWTNLKLFDGQIVGIGKDITERKQTESRLKSQVESEHLMRTVAQRIRQSLNLSDILNATVQEIRHLLKVDRVIVYQFAPDMSGKIVAESVGEGWTVSINTTIVDTCFQKGNGKGYYQGRKRAIANIFTAGLTECHLRLLERFEVKANLVVPIILKMGEENAGSRLWGLLIAHQCSNPRNWEESQLDLLDQLTVQIAIAIQQSSIFQQAQNELEQRQRAEIKLRSALAEKEVLLKEIHHRVKNNLQIVSGLLQLQSQSIQDPEVIKALRESQNRIESISLIHKNLYTAPNIGQLDAVDYINCLAANLLISYQIIPGRISLETQIDSVSLNVDQAIACGLVINELISNALKHAFPDNKPGKIIIILRNHNHNIEMIVQDNGIGLPNNLDWRNTNSLGLSLVYDLITEQLEGQIIVEHDQGTKFKIYFPQLTWHT
ncbi:MAG TPA: PAS domain S-box protein [Nostocaceae cyanobacterium]|nr:PAS domain S-box protein [Nostocaceae cyanobacterium]